MKNIIHWGNFCRRDLTKLGICMVMFCCASLHLFLFCDVLQSMDKFWFRLVPLFLRAFSFLLLSLEVFHNKYSLVTVSGVFYFRSWYHGGNGIPASRTCFFYYVEAYQAESPWYEIYVACASFRSNILVEIKKDFMKLTKIITILTSINVARKYIAEYFKFDRIKSICIQCQFHLILVTTHWNSISMHKHKGGILIFVII